MLENHMKWTNFLKNGNPTYNPGKAYYLEGIQFFDLGAPFHKSLSLNTLSIKMACIKL